LISTLQMLSLMQKTGKTVSQLTAPTKLLPHIVVNVKVKKKPPLHEIPELSRALDDAESRINGNGRLLVRYSGTENVLRVMIEGENQEMLSKMAEELTAIIERHIGV